MRAPRSCLGVLAWMFLGLVVIGLIRDYPWLLVFVAAGIGLRVWQSSQRRQREAVLLAEQQVEEAAQRQWAIDRHKQEREDLAASVARQLNVAGLRSRPSRCGNCGAPGPDRTSSRCRYCAEAY